MTLTFCSYCCRERLILGGAVIGGAERQWFTGWCNSCGDRLTREITAGTPPPPGSPRRTEVPPLPRQRGRA